MRAITQSETARFRKFSRAYVDYFGGKSPVMSAIDGSILIPRNEFSSESTFHSLQEAIDYYARYFSVD